MFEPLAKLLPKSLKRAGAQRRIEAAVILEKACFALADIFGKDMAARMRPVVFRDGELIVTCERSVYAREATLRGDEIIDRLNLRLGAVVVRKIRARS